MNLSSIQVTAYLLRSWHSAWHNACLHNPYPLISHSEDIYSFVILMSHRRKAQFGRVEVTSIPPQMSLPNIETMLAQVGQVLKMEIEESEICVCKRTL